MDVSIVNGSRMQLQSVAGASMKETAQPLQEKAPVLVSALDALDHAIGAVENGHSLEMHYDKDIGRVVVQVLDGQSGKVVFQVPSELVSSIKSFRNYLKVARKGV
jgi:uncharacterized FlaG/YvyC family protein